MDKKQIQVVSNGQYIKKLNFESSKSMHESMHELSTLNKISQPELEFKIIPRSEKLSENDYLVIIQIEVLSKIGDEQLFKIELEYAGEFKLTGEISKEIEEEILLVNCVTLLFPFARQEIADISLRARFQPIMLDPIDFKAAYLASKEQKHESKVANFS